MRSDGEIYIREGDLWYSPSRGTIERSAFLWKMRAHVGPYDQTIIDLMLAGF